jgi:hypothetical protein
VGLVIFLIFLTICFENLWKKWIFGLKMAMKHLRRLSRQKNVQLDVVSLDQCYSNCVSWQTTAVVLKVCRGTLVSMWLSCRHHMHPPCRWIYLVFINFCHLCHSGWLCRKIGSGILVCCVLNSLRTSGLHRLLSILQKIARNLQILKF